MVYVNLHLKQGFHMSLNDNYSHRPTLTFLTQVSVTPYRSAGIVLPVTAGLPVHDLYRRPLVTQDGSTCMHQDGH